MRAAFAFRREFAARGAPSWGSTCELDGKVWRMFTGERRMPAAATGAPILIRTGET